MFGRKRTVANDAIRAIQFGAVPISEWPTEDRPGDEFPWNEFIEARTHLRSGDGAAAKAAWHRVLEQPDLESRHYLQAWRFLAQNGEAPPHESEKTVLGVVVEVAMKQSYDLLSAYADHSAHYFNHAGPAIIWEHADESLDPAIDALLQAGQTLASLIGYWDGELPGPPKKHEARISFLTPGGLCFGQGHFEALSADPLAADVFSAGTTLMQQLMLKTQRF